MAPIVSKDDRIDLTQFDGYTKPDEKLFLEEMKEAFERAVVLEETVSDADANLALFAPHLLAELKRCYAMLDAIAYEVGTCSECGGHREEEGLFHYCQNYCRCEDFDASE